MGDSTFGLISPLGVGGASPTAMVAILLGAVGLTSGFGATEEEEDPEKRPLGTGRALKVRAFLAVSASSAALRRRSSLAAAALRAKISPGSSVVVGTVGGFLGRAVVGTPDMEMGRGLGAEVETGRGAPNMETGRDGLEMSEEWELVALGEVGSDLTAGSVLVAILVGWRVVRELARAVVAGGRREPEVVAVRAVEDAGRAIAGVARGAVVVLGRTLKLGTLLRLGTLVLGSVAVLDVEVVLGTVEILGAAVVREIVLALGCVCLQLA